MAKPVQVPRHVGVDEKSAGKGYDYVTVVSDLERGTVEHVADDRKEASLDSYFVKFKPEQLAAIEAVAMDMWDPFVASVRTHLADPDHKIVFDLFHIMRQMGTAVDTVRKREHRALRAGGDDSLVGSKYTNAGAESLNSRIQAIRVAARGFRNRDHFKTAIYFHCGGLNLYPVTHGIPG